MPQVTILKRSAEEGVQTQRKFFKKTAKGKVVKGRFLPIYRGQSAPFSETLIVVLRERYLRDDVACGIEGICTSSKPPLPPRGDLTHRGYFNGHFIIPDTNVFLHQVDGLHRS